MITASEPSCLFCGYSRAGLAGAAACPECGAAPDARPPARITRRDLANAARLILPAAAALALVYAFSPRGEAGAAVGAPAAIVRAGAMVWLGAGCWMSWGGSRSAGETGAPVARLALSLVVAGFGMALIEAAAWLVTALARGLTL